MDAKQALRTELRRQAKRLAASDFSHEDAMSCDALLQSSAYKQATMLFAYAPMEDEVNITALLEHAIANKALALPACKEDGNITFLRVENLASLTAGRYGILEPKQDLQVEPTMHDLLVIPGLAYTRNGRRLGRGKGYYDRYLASNPGFFTIGICRSHQLLEDIPTDAWDKSVRTVLCAGVFY